MKLAVRPLARCVRTCLLGRRQRLRSGPRYPVRDRGGRPRRLARELRISAADARHRFLSNSIRLPLAGTIALGSGSTSIAQGKGRMYHMTDDSEIAWHREQIVKNRTLLEELEAANTAGGDVFPETRSEIEHLKAQIAQSELIVAASEKTRS